MTVKKLFVAAAGLGRSSPKTVTGSEGTPSPLRQSLVLEKERSVGHFRCHNEAFVALEQGTGAEPARVTDVRVPVPEVDREPLMET